jgi:hypothetical protein
MAFRVGASTICSRVGKVSPYYWALSHARLSANHSGSVELEAERAECALPVVGWLWCCIPTTPNGIAESVHARLANRDSESDLIGLDCQAGTRGGGALN